MNLIFEAFDVEQNDVCDNGGCCDYLEISYGNISQKYCGSAIHGPFSNINTTMTITFHSDRYGTRSGFLATFCCSVKATEILSLYRGGK